MTISIEPLLCGTLAAPRSAFAAGVGDERCTAPIPSWLIRHPAGIALFDTGMHPDHAPGGGQLHDWVSKLFEVGLDESTSVTARLASRGVDAADVDVVVLSHLHFDHAGGLAQLPNARVVVHRDEWASLRDGPPFGLRPGDVELGHEILEVDDGHDVFGDGRVVCLATPGHTPGHQSLRVRLTDREVVLCGDCAYFEETLDGGPLPAFGHDLEQQARSVRRLRAARSDGALVIPGHDPVTIPALPERMT